MTHESALPFDPFATFVLAVIRWIILISKNDQTITVANEWQKATNGADIDFKELSIHNSPGVACRVRIADIDFKELSIHNGNKKGGGSGSADIDFKELSIHNTFRKIEN